MATVFQIAALIAMLAVAIVLLRGLWNMMRAGDSNTSQKLMQMRVFIQFIAIVLIVGALYFARPA
ncbi:twin transmembrane helix small protein [Notoacmeibacter ruber]|uniref:Twin transmembrane helix small protein n=1 Tax=Notoacmeibacter ruber TaxID=2670375 RepID=A0A3L7JE64_9HYPH|nr:twin transmembrane helix small protein [Notoacmeibacter ruber]RLQ88605.1 twin transmembrane helix small protein [Notoacmeibacter ruber]